MEMACDRLRKKLIFQAEWLSVPGLGRVYGGGGGGAAVCSLSLSLSLGAGSTSFFFSIVSLKKPSALIRPLLAPKNNITCLPIRETDKS